MARWGFSTATAGTLAIAVIEGRAKPPQGAFSSDGRAEGAIIVPNGTAIAHVAHVRFCNDQL